MPRSAQDSHSATALIEEEILLDEVINTILSDTLSERGEVSLDLHTVNDPVVPYIVNGVS